MDLEAEISQASFLHDSSTAKLKLMATSGANGVAPVTAVEEAAAAVVAASRATAVFAEPIPAAPLASTTITNTNTIANANANTSATNGSKPVVVDAAKKAVRYRECQKNHAAGIGGHALDGCGEFMPSGDEGSIDALKCSACDCHRNFHRREVEGSKDAKKKLAPPSSSLVPLQQQVARSPGALVALSDHSDDHLEQQQQQQQHHHSTAYSLAHHLIPSAIKKRFRTKFTNEQKEKMFHFADRLGWKIQKHDEGEVQQFCADVGVKRHVLKVWMHNNKNTFGKKLS